MRATIAIGVLLASAAAAGAETAPDVAPASAAAQEWKFVLAPYLWATAMEGTVGADGTSTDVDVSFSDILDVLDVGALASFEARRGKLSLTSNVIYMKMSTDAGRPVGPGIGPFPPGSLDAEVDSQSLIFEGRATWEVLSLPLFGDGDPRRVALDVGPVFRVWWLDNEVDAKLRPGFPGGPFSASFDQSKDWVDFAAGARVRTRLSEKVGLVISGDYGGFDVGSSSHRTWSLAGFASYRLGEHWDLAAGWRVLEIDRSSADLELSGPLVGASYRF